jgi:hypothetical protein
VLKVSDADAGELPAPFTAKTLNQYLVRDFRPVTFSEVLVDNGLVTVVHVLLLVEY